MTYSDILSFCSRRILRAIVSVIIGITVLLYASNCVFAENSEANKTTIGTIHTDRDYAILCTIPDSCVYETASNDQTNGEDLFVSFQKADGEGPVVELYIFQHSKYMYPNINRMPYEEYVEFLYNNYAYEGACVSQGITTDGDIYIISFDSEYINDINIGAILDNHIIRFVVRKASEDDDELTINDSLAAEELLDTLEIVPLGE